MLNDQDLRKIRKEIGEVIEDDVNPQFEEVRSDIRGLRREVGEVIESNINPQFEEIRNEIDEIKTTMATLVTKSYLDDKLADLKGGLIVRLRREDTKVNRLVDVLKKRKVLEKTDVKTLSEIQIFPTVRVK